ncbi:trigger factor [Paludibaculum fermentans]|uniref:Trigger factor n=1 Tax=Paludibaculum fermentans TaxID=1473598 RepID=A0A7S7NME4_PALFE|nr:trigger factor [Paludibaculum fermentans]QOY86313.1 trigger factor [Paludibaculum fermentans]
MALIEGCKHSLDIHIPADAVAAEIEKVVEKVRAKAHIQGFRPGKAPASIIRSKFMGDIRQEALENLIPKYLDKECEKENLHVVSRPNVKDLHFHEGEAVHFKAEFEVAPEFELKETRGLTVEYAEPVVEEADIDARIEEIRESKAEFVNVDPRPAQDGDHCLVSLRSIEGIDGEPMTQDDINIEIGGKDTFQAFSDALRGAEPGDVNDAEITYPADYAAERLAGKTVKFAVTLNQIRLKEAPELNDDFAKDLGDFQNIAELREEIRKAIFREREFAAQNEAKNKLIDKLVDMHDFPVPDAYVDNQIENTVESQMRQWQAQGIDTSKIKLDWTKLKDTQKDKARRDVMASLLLGKLATTESIGVTNEEMDAEVQRIARQKREPVAAARMRMEKDGSLSRIANRIITEKTLNFLFEHAVKEAPTTPPEPAPAE